MELVGSPIIELGKSDTDILSSRELSPCVVASDYNILTAVDPDACGMRIRSSLVPAFAMSKFTWKQGAYVAMKIDGQARIGPCERGVWGSRMTRMSRRQEGRQDWDTGSVRAWCIFGTDMQDAQTISRRVM